MIESNVFLDAFMFCLTDDIELIAWFIGIWLKVLLIIIVMYIITIVLTYMFSVPVYVVELISSK